MLNIAGKVFNGLVSLTMVLFSSYEGNNASFSLIHLSHLNGNIRIQTSLVSAFDNDFEQIFRSGSPIVIRFNLEVKKENEIVGELSYKNEILYDPMSRFFQIEAESANNYTYVQSYSELIALISEVDIFYDYNGIEGAYSFKLSTQMDKVNLASIDREFDLMLLWNFKTPTAIFEYKIEPYES